MLPALHLRFAYRITQRGATSTNMLIDIVKFFSDYVFQDLQAEQGYVHPILWFDVIRFLCTFRNQLTKSQFPSVIPLLVRYLGSSSYVTYIYVATTIGSSKTTRYREYCHMVLAHAQKIRFAQVDIREFASESISTLPANIVENDHIMKCVMRVITTARQTLTPVYQTALARLVTTLGVAPKNPSNPWFDQFIFESLSGLLWYIFNLCFTTTHRQ
ncbi:Cse1-domain-containing protein [Infundibulicybe gibba]|nr:Cse1-domain-containing protein [Infundibulicybe gibba]